jgi:hypothetical protein
MAARAHTSNLRWPIDGSAGSFSENPRWWGELSAQVPQTFSPRSLCRLRNHMNGREWNLKYLGSVTGKARNVKKDPLGRTYGCPRETRSADGTLQEA